MDPSHSNRPVGGGPDGRGVSAQFSRGRGTESGASKGWLRASLPLSGVHRAAPRRGPLALVVFGPGVGDEERKEKLRGD